MMHNLAGYLDATLLKPEATADQVQQFITQSHASGCYAVCIAPSMLPLIYCPAGLQLATVVGFPNGTQTPETKAFEARQAVSFGATEIDMVLDLANVLSGDFASVLYEITAVRDVIHPDTVLKVIIESAALNEEQIIAACLTAQEAKADFVKTSTGFHPAGGASIAAVKLMAKTVGDTLGVKASGGIRDRETALAMIAAGATRLGVSAAAAILADSGADAIDGY